MENSALEPCPICRGKADYNWQEKEDGTKRYFCHCAPEDALHGCVRQDILYATKREAIVAWNTRHEAAKTEQPLVATTERGEELGEHAEFATEVWKTFADHMLYQDAEIKNGIMAMEYALKVHGLLNREATQPDECVPFEASTEMLTAGARAIGRTMRWPNHNERAKEIWECMLKAHATGELGATPTQPETPAKEGL